MRNAGQRGKTKEPEDFRVRRLVREVVPQRIEQWAAVAGVRSTEQFQEDVTEALHAFMRAHRFGPRRRWSIVRRAFLDVADDYAALSKVLGHALPPEYFVYPRFEGLPQLDPEPPLLRAALRPFGKPDDFKKLAKTAKKYAAACALDKGGVLPSAFDELCVGETGSSGLWGALEGAAEERRAIKSRFRRLVEAVWPVACEIANTVPNRSVQSPPVSSGALRKRLQRLLAQRGRR